MSDEKCGKQQVLRAIYEMMTEHSKRCTLWGTVAATGEDAAKIQGSINRLMHNEEALKPTFHSDFDSIRDQMVKDLMMRIAKSSNPFDPAMSLMVINLYRVGFLTRLMRDRLRASESEAAMVAEGLDNLGEDVGRLIANLCEIGVAMGVADGNDPEVFFTSMMAEADRVHEKVEAAILRVAGPAND